MNYRWIFWAVALYMIATGFSFAQTAKTKKILVIGVDGMIYTALDYATTPGLDRLIADASYSKEGYGGLPANSTTGWSTLLTGVGVDKHGVRQANSFFGNHLDQYPSLVKRIKNQLPAIRIASIVREPEINTVLNSDADLKYNHGSDVQVFDQAKEVLGGQSADAVFVQFSSPKEVGLLHGYQLRKADYVLAIQQVDTYIAQLLDVIQSRATYADENWAIFVVSTHGGSESGLATNSTVEELKVPVIFSGADLDNKELLTTNMVAKENSDNFLTINKAPTGDRTYGRIPIAGTGLQGMDKFTIEMWIKAGANSSDPSIMGDKDWDSGGNPGFVICRSGSSWKINIANTQRSRYDIGSSKPIEDGKWHHIAVTFDKTKECIVYQDGERVGGAALTYKETDQMASPFNYIYMAQEGTGTYGGGAPNWAGSFNEVRIWTTALSQETIKNYMHLQHIEKSNHPHLNFLNLYLKLDEVRGTVLTDYSGKNNHAELVGPATERKPYYPVGLTDVAVNVLSHMGIRVDGAWNLDGSALKSNVPFRLFKVN
ncbi:hypothetical protein FAZ19_07595 [Sphingobacterium alkalisoli]|uniref:LamG-like jellyroll fold domain-containing protein n=1 Tax=Sphingobacterium alkalisoli TaxID=1874115 RepID=A0A4U0H4X0_9SPHI|nr:LamG-like jellyroll fold domain-containing protein [Sphingobacterium alkalisoli]TJY66773.1 hypothetical protein FAZ19_07595 [Sphingobacterium alkalisoli]GGH14308.1 hypothetical protein GCM10011418_15150 [Sphingobacterium alkalisoli]